MKEALIKMIKSCYSPEHLCGCKQMISQGIKLLVFSSIEISELLAEYEKKELEIEDELKSQLKYLKSYRNENQY
jgi:hypothetical protein